MKKPKIRYIRFGKKDLAMLLFILLTVSCAIISVVMLQDAYDSDILNATTDLSSLSDSSMSSTKTTTTKKLTSKISKKTTMMTSKTKKSSRTVRTTTQTQPKALRSVYINIATAEEISDCLNIEFALAERIVDMRNKIHFFSNSLELLMVNGFSESMHERLKDYIIL
ncbi:MAG: helix-hairpin-helix domain-containing protein [Ruminococcus sp.]|nr:helix-hairpin-helix domain-containing protein [Ruminococcus sp.]